MRTRLEELDRLAADLANVNTVGYKTERAANVASERDEFATALEAAVDVVLGGKKIDFKPGLIAATGRDLDVAIDGRGFFVLETETGNRYTRNGSFTRRSDGTLVASTGEPVLGEGGSSIRLPNGPIRIGEDGTITSGNTLVGRLASELYRVPPRRRRTQN
jgi:flagellar hook-basal body protein